MAHLDKGKTPPPFSPCILKLKVKRMRNVSASDCNSRSYNELWLYRSKKRVRGRRKHGGDKKKRTRERRSGCEGRLRRNNLVQRGLSRSTLTSPFVARKLVEVVGSVRMTCTGRMMWPGGIFQFVRQNKGEP